MIPRPAYEDRIRFVFDDNDDVDFLTKIVLWHFTKTLLQPLQVGDKKQSVKFSYVLL